MAEAITPLQAVLGFIGAISTLIGALAGREHLKNQREQRKLAAEVDRDLEAAKHAPPQLPAPARVPVALPTASPSLSPVAEYELARIELARKSLRVAELEQALRRVRQSAEDDLRRQRIALDEGANELDRVTAALRHERALVDQVTRERDQATVRGDVLRRELAELRKQIGGSLGSDNRHDQPAHDRPVPDRGDVRGAGRGRGEVRAQVARPVRKGDGDQGR